MSDDTSRDFDEQSSKRLGEQVNEGPTSDRGAGASVETTVQYPTSLLGDARLGGRGNQPVQTALLQRMQREYGNRALQRFLQRKSSGDGSGGDDDLADRISAKSGGGSSLDTGTRASLETR